MTFETANNTPTTTAMVACGFSPALAVGTVIAVWHYVNGFVLQEQTERQEYRETRTDPLTVLAEHLDDGASATLVVAIREGGNPLGEQASNTVFEP